MLDATGTLPSIPLVGLTENVCPLHIVEVKVEVTEGIGLINAFTIKVAPIHKPVVGTTEY
jgi:hypothetical protein